MPEEELDDLFRKSASEFHPEFDPAAWQAMEKKLDARPPGFWPRIGWLTALLLIMSLGFWLSQSWLQHKPERPQAVLIPDSTLLERLSTENEKSRPPQARKALAPKPANGPAKLAKPAARQAPAGAVSRVLPAKSALAQQVPAAGEKSTEMKALPMREKQLFAQKQGHQSVIPAFSAPLKPSAPGQEQALPEKPAGEDQNGQAVSQVNPAVTTGPLALTFADSLAQTSQPANTSLRPKRRFLDFSRLGLRLLLAPDLSTVGFSRPDGISTNVGIEVNYQLGSRWRLGSGVVLARKVYGAQAEDYGKADYWKGRSQPQSIDAVCRVLDIPLNIGYQVLTRNKSTFSLSTGLSSYLMLSEEYHYYYKGYGKPYTKTYEVRNENRHLFSIYNLSGLYSHRLTSDMAWGIEPFVKVPLSGVGAGQVKLASSGVFFSLSYRFR